MRIISRKTLNDFAAIHPYAEAALTDWYNKLKAASLLSVPRTETEYQRLVELLNALIDRVGEDETHPLASLMDIVGELIAHYEDQRVPEPA